MITIVITIITIIIIFIIIIITIIALSAHECVLLVIVAIVWVIAIAIHLRAQWDGLLAVTRVTALIIGAACTSFCSHGPVVAQACKETGKLRGQHLLDTTEGA